MNSLRMSYFSLIFSLLYIQTTFAETSYKSRFTDFVIKQDYMSAMAIADSVEHLGSSVFVPLMRATCLYFQSLDYESIEYKEQISIEIDRIVNTVTPKLQNDEATAEEYFALGTSTVFSALIEDRFMRGVYTIRKMLQAGKYFEKAVAKEPEYWDAYYGLGSYYYYRSANAGLLRTIGIVSDRREEGLALLETAAEKGELTSILAYSSLAWIALDRREYDKAIEIASAKLEMYPDNRSFMWCIGRAERSAKRWDKSALMYERLLSSLVSLSINNNYNIFTCRNALVECYMNMEEWDQVLKHAEKALEIELKPEQKKRRDKDINNLRKHIEQAKERVYGGQN